MTSRRRPSRRARRAATAAAAAAGLVALAGSVTNQLKAHPVAAALVTCTAAMVAAALGALTRTSGNEPGLDEAAEDLARAVGAQWRDEDERRHVNDPIPLPVRWQTVEVGLTDHWANISHAPAGEDAGPLELAGRIDEIMEVYRRVPSGRMVVLGRAGSGKTILVLQLVLQLLAAREPGDPVPVIFNLSSWDPTAASLHDWLTAQLVRDHPGLEEPGPDGASLADGLVTSGRILPVLDGFDEIATGLHRDALQALNRTSRPLLLTSRPAEYATAVTQTDVLTAAAGIELADLSPADLCDYLPRTARPRATADGELGTVWDPVLRCLRDQPPSPAAAQLIAVLATPLMVALARTVYSDAPGRDPAELLDQARFPTTEALEDHLLAEFVPAVYRDPPHRHGDQRRGRSWDAREARRRLGWLAKHLNNRHTRDLAWWQLGDGASRLTRGLAAATFFGLLYGISVGLVYLYFFSRDGGLSWGLVGARVTAFSFGLGGGLTAGLVFGMVTGSEPSRMQMRISVPTKRRWREIGTRVAGGLAAGLVYGLTWSLAVAWAANAVNPGPDEYAGWLAYGLETGLLIGPIGGLVAGLAALFEAPVDVETAVSPSSLLADDRTKTIVQASAVGVAAAVGCSLPLFVPGPAVSGIDLLLGLRDALLGGLGIGLIVGLSLNAWGRWLVLSRFWLPITGRLPWAVVAFLEDACRRGVLRRAGPVYQFRHARLQEHLADNDRTR